MEHCIVIGITFKAWYFSSPCITSEYIATCSSHWSYSALYIWPLENWTLNNFYFSLYLHTYCPISFVLFTALQSACLAVNIIDMILLTHCHPNLTSSSHPSQQKGLHVTPHREQTAKLTCYSQTFPANCCKVFGSVFYLLAPFFWIQVEEFTCEKEGEGGGEKEKEGRLECSTDWDGDAVMASRQGHTTPR